MSWIDKLLGREEKSGAVAKQRLQMVLIHDRNDISPGLMEQLKDDIIAVIADRLEIAREDVVVNLNQKGQESRLVAEVPLPGNGRRRSSSS
jgi:cell division topological specificity factor